MQRAGKARRVAPIAPRPTGRVTFLFTDIEGSTQRWERDDEAMKIAVARHDAVLRSVFEQHAGHIFKTVGDAFCVAFERASVAVEAATAAQQTLALEDFASVGGLRVRMALHSGSADERGGDYFGTSVNRVARLISIGHGGQVLISDATRGLVGDTLPRGTSLVDLGLHQLKDLTQLEHVWQLQVEGLAREFAPLRSEGGAPNNLPAQPTTFIGREHDAREVLALLADSRIVTLVGAGGVGKTRLALNVAAAQLRVHPDGVWFADLAPISDGALVPSVIAKALGIVQQESKDTEDTLLQSLTRKNLLLVLDNCEHVIGASAQLAHAIVTSCPQVRVLATSRQPLRISGEAVYKLPSLPTPEHVAELRADEALGFGAIALFVDRARAANAGFTLTDTMAPQVAEICRRLDGIPLAIELAAARVKMLSVASLAGRLDERFRILTGGSRAALPRQQTLRALFDWSFDLLDRSEQTLFRRLSVFAGGFGFDAAAAICHGGEVEEDDVFELLASLVDKSLVVAEIRADNERYSLLESAREFARSKLDAQESAELVERHARFFRGMATAADAAAHAMSREAMIAALDPDLDNFRAALDWSIKQGRDPLTGAAIAGALEQLWYAGGLSAEGRSWIAAGLDAVDEREHPRLVARLWLARSLLGSGAAKLDAAQRAKNIYERIGDTLGAARGSRTMGRALLQMGRLDDAAAASKRALPVLLAKHDRMGVALCQNVLADVAGERHEVDAARDLYAQTLRSFEQLGDAAGRAVVFIDLAELDFQQGDPAGALRNAQKAVAIESLGKNATNLATAYSNIAAYHIALQDLDAASVAAANALAWAQRVQSKSKLAWALQHCALITAMRGDAANAAELLGYVDRQFAELGVERESTERWSQERLLALLHEQLDDAALAAHAAAGAAMPEEAAMSAALEVVERAGSAA